MNDKRFLVDTEDVTINLEGLTIRVRRIPWHRNPTKVMWRVEHVDKHGTWWPLNPKDYQLDAGIYRWWAPKEERD